MISNHEHQSARIFQPKAHKIARLRRRTRVESGLSRWSSRFCPLSFSCLNPVCNAYANNPCQSVLMFDKQERAIITLLQQPANYSLITLYNYWGEKLVSLMCCGWKQKPKTPTFQEINMSPSRLKWKKKPVIQTWIYGIHKVQGKENDYTRFNQMYIFVSMVTDYFCCILAAVYPDTRELRSANSCSFII